MDMALPRADVIEAKQNYLEDYEPHIISILTTITIPFIEFNI